MDGLSSWLEPGRAVGLWLGRASGLLPITLGSRLYSLKIKHISSSCAVFLQLKTCQMATLGFFPASMVFGLAQQTGKKKLPHQVLVNDFKILFKFRDKTFKIM